MKQSKASILFFLLLSLSASLFGQNKIIDSLRIQLKSTGKDTNRFNLLSEIIRKSRVDYPDTALRYSKQAETLANEIQDPVRIARALNLLGSSYYYHSEFEKAELYQKKSLEVCKQYHLIHEEANAVGSLALAYQVQSKYDKSIETYYEALKIEEQNHNLKGIIKSHSNLAILYRNLSDYNNALKHALKAYKILKASFADWDIAIASSSNTIGLSYLDMQNYDSAAVFLKEAYRLNKKENNTTYTANSASNISFCYIKQKQTDSAARYIDIAYQLYPKISSQSIKALILINLGSVRDLQNNLPEAFSYTNQGLKLAKAVNVKSGILDGYRTLAEIFTRKGDYKNAFIYSDRAYKLNDSLKVTEANRMAANLQRDYEIQKKQQSIDLLAQEAQLREAKLANEQKVRIYLIVSIALLVVTAAATYYGFVQKMKSNRRLQFKNEEIAHKNELLEGVNQSLQDQALRSQMKPHFIFNALNSIQFLILKKENEKAFDYLSKFSQLLRSALEFSDKDFIELDKELAWLELYVQIESLRFNYGFDFKIENLITPESLSKIQVPPFLIQPFLENAIAHGLMTKPTNRQLTLKVMQHGAVLNISIADNGIGREASAKLNASNGKKHQSIAMDLVNKRLVILKSITGKNFYCQVEDGVSPTGEKEGTIVKLQMPA
jgi:tetratricopeptide (TPR) repeat protein